ncbi:uncharacterized protein C7orf57 homolog isoform X2 [Lampris incognitus]|uniref:uncharacterized protein C7orf57 homolog isoform X2 n=1 Tax=Lampris incognitus TaxID=2546036 RepID=UPI0024B5A052|nr:uncharacterized protein C7orf57 homolog isoform X2 [Lampris incognitus]
MSSGRATADMMSSARPSTKSGQKTEGHTQISQISGFCSGSIHDPEEKACGHRVGVLQTDSDCVELAKQAGNKDLLRHEEVIISKPISYKTPEWFGPAAEDSNDKLSLAKNREKKSPSHFQLTDPPFGNDSKSVWERGESSNRKECENTAPNSQMEELSLSSTTHENRFKKTCFNKNPAPVDMSKLLSFGYAEGDKMTSSDD